MFEFAATSKAAFDALQNEFNIAKAQAMPKDRTSGERNSVADTKSVGKPPIFAHGEMKNFPNWEFSVMLYLTATHRDNIKAAEVMTWARAQTVQITPGDIDTNLHVIPDVQYMNFDLYFILASFTDNEAKKIVRQCKFGAGFEAWRRLTLRFDPKSSGRGFVQVVKLGTPKLCKLEELAEGIVSWETEVSQYEDTSGQTYPEQHKQAAIMKMCPPALYDHITLNSDSYVSYEDLRSKIFKYIELRATSDRSKPQPGAGPMDIGSFAKGGKMGKGWK